RDATSRPRHGSSSPQPYRREECRPAAPCSLCLASAPSLPAAPPAGGRPDRYTGRVIQQLARAVNTWFDREARDLPWRRADASAWAVLVSEFMLQQTQVSRVEPRYRAWLERWPTPCALAADEPGEAVRAWDRLGYPR